MATAAQWVQGARPPTLPNAVAPVVAGVGAAAAHTETTLAEVSWLRAALALLVALSLILGVNFANDYADGVRGTDSDRVGPLRLVGSGVASPSTVRAVAIGWLAAAAVAGTALVALTGRWWLLAVGATCIAGAWFYTGGRRPYGYSGLGEVAVFAFFGPVAVVGTQLVVSGGVSAAGAATGVAVGCLSAAVLVANNLRDIPTDAAAGKRTLAVALGDRRTRLLYAGLVTVPFAVSAGLAAAVTPAALTGLLAAPLVVSPARRVLAGVGGRVLVPVLRVTGVAMLAWATLTALALALGS